MPSSDSMKGTFFSLSFQSTLRGHFGSLTWSQHVCGNEITRKALNETVSQAMVNENFNRKLIFHVKFVEPARHKSNKGTCNNINAIF
jgi:hypothetical protein